jgi:hypothetical protein
MTPKEKAAERATKWNKENKERRKEIRDKWVANNLEKMRAMRKAWKAANPDKVRAESAKWMRDHPEVRAANQSNRRARIVGAGGSFASDQIRDLVLRQNGCCAICKNKLPTKFHRDHVIPIALGGSNDILNIQILCPSCNLRKGAKHPIEFAQQIGMLL